MPTLQPSPNFFLDSGQSRSISKTTVTSDVLGGQRSSLCHMEPPAVKRRKLSLGEVPSIINAALETAEASGDSDGTDKELDAQADEGVCCGVGPEDDGLIKHQNELHFTAAIEHLEDPSTTSKLSVGAKETAGQWEAAVSQEMEDENTQIQSSLPLYLDHVFGQGLGLCRQTPPKQQGSAEDWLAMPVESQGFLPTLQVEESPSPKDGRVEAPVSPLLFNSPSPESSPNKEALNSCNLQNANALSAHFTAESASSKDDNIIQPSDETKSPQDEVKVQKSPSSCRNAQQTVTVHQSYGHGGQKRRRSPGCQKKPSREKYPCPPTCNCLADCTEAGKTVCLFGVVLQVNCVMEVACRSGSVAGQTVQMSSLLLGDPTKSFFKLSLWREAAGWVERIAVGDIVYFSNIKLKRWQRESVGHTMMCSTVLNLHLPKKELPTRVRQTIPPECLHSLKQWAMKRHGYLFPSSSPTPKSQMLVHFKASHELGAVSVVHFRAKLLAAVSSRVMLLADEPVKEVHLYLLSVEASLWHSQLSRGVGQVWEFLYLSTAPEGTQGCYSLQTTSRSQLRNLKSDCDIASEILQRFPSGHTPSISKNCTIEDILKHKESGIFECQARAVSLGFQLEDGSNLLVSSLLKLTSLEVVSRLCHAVYIGCESCSKPLQQDVNGVYCQCVSCMSRKPGAGYPTSSHFFRPLTVVLHDGSAHVEVTASHAIVSKMFDVNPSSVAKARLSQDLGQCEELAEKLNRTEALVRSSIADNLWIVSCMFTKDENSFLESVSLSLLDWQHVQK